MKLLPDPELIGKLVGTALKPLVDRVTALERRNLADAYKGIFRVDESYSRGDLTTHKGGCWLALRDNNSEPGTDSSWKLIAKP